MALVCDSYKSAPFASGAKKMTMAVMLIKCYVIASSFVIVSSTSLANISNETSTTQQSDPIILQVKKKDPERLHMMSVFIVPFCRS